MRRKAQERILLMMAALIIAVMFLKLTYAVALNIVAIVESLVMAGILLAGGYYGAKRTFFK